MPTEMNLHFDKERAGRQRAQVQQGEHGVKGKTVVDDAIPAGTTQGGVRPSTPNAKKDSSST